jgi:hypothetical protein
MAIITGNHVATCDTLAHFKDWAQFVSDGLVTNGFVRTGDAGQVNWAGIGAIPDQTSPAWEVMTDADALHGTYPMYIKLSYSRVGSSGGNVPLIQIQGGTGTNGSGTLANPGPTLTSYTSLTAYGTAVPCYVVGDTGKFALLMWRDANVTSGQTVLWLDRSRNSSGAATSSYFSYGVFAHQRSQLITIFNGKPFFGSSGTSDSQTNLLTRVANSLIYGGDTTISPVMPYVGGLGNPVLSVVGAFSADIAEAGTYSVNIYGGTHTYLFTKLDVTMFDGASSSTTAAVGIIYE